MNYALGKRTQHWPPLCPAGRWFLVPRGQGGGIARIGPFASEEDALYVGHLIDTAVAVSGEEEKYREILTIRKLYKPSDQIALAYYASVGYSARYIIPDVKDIMHEAGLIIKGE